ncbi:MAG: hypothetical protein A2096_14365 [Spirochaetes bacterium GWF1_41_5]|nr:MAG: hypothetical protein A2096_14365 [Spirochaetes bacterium GWF1_41_5]
MPHVIKHFLQTKYRRVSKIKIASVCLLDDKKCYPKNSPQSWKIPVFQKGNFMRKLSNLFKNGTIFMPFIVVKTVKRKIGTLEAPVVVMLIYNT